MAKVPVELLEEDERTQTERTAETLQITEDDADDLLRGLEELRNAQGIVFQVYRTQPVEREGMCADYPANIFSLAKLSKEYGPGTYRVRIKGEGGRYIKGGGTIKIAAPEVGAETATAAPQSSVQDMIAMLRADREKSSINIKEWAAIITPIAAPILANIFTQKRETVADMVGALAALKQLEPPTPKQPDALAEIDRVSALLERAKELGGGGNTTGATWVDVLRDGLGTVKDLIVSGAAGRLMSRVPGAPPQPMIPLITTAPLQSGTMPAQPSASAPPPQATSINTGASAAGSSTTPVTTEDPMLAMLPWLRATLDSLCYQASRNKDPMLYAEVTLDNLPDGADVRQLLSFIEAADWWQKLQGFAPQVIPYAGWFQEFRDALIKEIKKLMAGAPESDSE